MGSPMSSGSPILLYGTRSRRGPSLAVIPRHRSPYCPITQEVARTVGDLLLRVRALEAELFDRQSEQYRQSVLPSGVTARGRGTSFHVRMGALRGCAGPHHRNADLRCIGTAPRAPAQIRLPARPDRSRGPRSTRRTVSVPSSSRSGVTPVGFRELNSAERRGNRSGDRRIGSTLSFCRAARVVD